MNSQALPYRIRPMTSGDIPTVAALERRIFLDPWPFSAYVQELHFNASARYFVVELANPALAPQQWPWKTARSASLLGYVGMRWEGTRVHISTLAVREAWRGRGLGELLLLAVLEEAVQHNARSAQLEVRVSNKVAQSLYKKYGFVVQSRLGNYYRDGEDAYLMCVEPLGHAYGQKLAAYRAALDARLMAQPRTEVLNVSSS